MAAETPDRIDIARLQGLLGDIESLPVTQVINSPPRSAESLVPRTPARHPPAATATTTVFVTPGTHVTRSHSHDRAGDLSLDYSDGLSCSQPDLGETQADTVLYGLTQFDRPGGMSPGEPELEMVRGTPEADDGDVAPPKPPSAYPPLPFDDTLLPDGPHAFSSPLVLMSPPPQNPAGHNPLSHMPFGSRMPMSLAQMFDVASSPRRPLAAGTSLPPTPSAAEATRLMARAFSRMPSNFFPPGTAVDEEEDEEETTPLGSPTQPDTVRAYVSMQESQEARERESRKRGGRRRASFERSLSPVVFNSSFAVRPRAEQESDDEVVSQAEETRRRADRARRKGDEEVKRLFTAVKVGQMDRARSEDVGVGKTSKRRAERTVIARKRTQVKSASPAGDETGDETGDEEEADAPPVAPTASEESTAPTATTEEDDVSLPMNRPPAAQTTSDAPEKKHPSAPQYPQPWESLHQVPVAAVVRRSRSNPTAIHHESSVLSERLLSRGHTATPPPDSAVADSQPLLPVGRQKTWLRSLPPFNIPSPTPRIVPEFVQETSGLIGLDMVSSPAPRRTAVLGTTPCRGETTRKRKRRLSLSEDRVPCSVEETCGFRAMDEETAGFLSSRPEPDDVDMLGIVADVGAGRDLESMGVTPRAARVERGKSAKRVKVTPKTADVARSAAAAGSSRGACRSKSKSKSLVRKTRSSVGFGNSVGVPDTPTPVVSAAAAAAAMDTDDEADILTSRNPAFSLSVAAPSLDAAATVPERVFALFRDGKTSYHPATVLENDPYTGTVRVVFDDGTQDLLERAYVRALDLRAGDSVKVDIPGMKKATWEVQGFADVAVPPGKYSDCRGHTTVSVKARKTAGAEPAEVVPVPVTNIYLIKSMWKEFHTRVYRELPVAPPPPLSSQLQLQIRNATPSESYSASTTPSKALRHTPSTGTFLSRPLGGGMFAGMVFALSFGDKESVKKAITTKILQNGGRIVDAGFEELFYDIDRPTPTTATAAAATTTTFSSFSSSETTAVTTTSPIHFTPRPETDRVGFVAVIADTHSRRAKFLQALALGLPCLAPRWIEDCCRKAKVVGWEHYLLPAGESRYLGAIRSRILDKYDARAARMKAVVARRGRLLQGRGVVVVVAGGTRACERRKPYLFLTYALGAARVARAVNLEGAQQVLEAEETAAAEKWDFVYVEAKDKERAEKMWGGGGKGKKAKVKVVDDEWIVQSLILGRLIDDD